jgi:hypothetical protein
MVTKVAAASASQANTQNAQNVTQKNNAAVSSFAAAMQKAKTQAAANNAQAGSPNGYVQNLKNDVQVLNTHVYSIHDPLYSQQVRARQDIYSNLMHASENGQIDSVLKGLSSSDLQTINSQLERGLSLYTDPAFTQTNRDDLFKAMVNGGASGMSLARLTRDFTVGADALSMLNASGMKPGVTDQLLTFSDTNQLFNYQLGTTSQGDMKRLFQNFNQSHVSAANLQRVADSLSASVSGLPNLANFIAATGVEPSLGFGMPPQWSAYSPSNPNGDPINIIIAGNSKVNIGQILQELEKQKGWGQVATGLGISEQDFNAGEGPQAQNFSLRQGGYSTEFNNPVAGLFGTLTGNPALAALGNPPFINHFRVWQQPGTNADFISASYEYFTVAKPTADGLKPIYHNVVSFDDARTQLMGDLQAVANAKGWHIDTLWMRSPSGAGLGSDNVPYDGEVAVLTIT